MIIIIIIINAGSFRVSLVIELAYQLNGNVPWRFYDKLVGIYCTKCCHDVILKTFYLIRDHVTKLTLETSLRSADKSCILTCNIHSLSKTKVYTLGWIMLLSCQKIKVLSCMEYKREKCMHRSCFELKAFRCHCTLHNRVVAGKPR